jgi:LPXTG-motif cell wall-anchored protein
MSGENNAAFLAVGIAFIAIGIAGRARKRGGRG